MKFGRSAAEAADEPGRGGAGGQYMRYLKDGDNVFRILQEPEEWTYYWEHFNPAGYSFPCPRGANDPIEDCPGCSSDIEKMKKVGRRVAFNILHSFNGVEYVDVMKVGTTVADKLDNRYKRFGTVTDRDYTVTRYKTSGDRYDFDVEGSTPVPVDLRKEDWKDPEELLAAAYDEAWGDGQQAQANRSISQQTSASSVRKMAIAPQPAQSEEPPFEEKAYQESDLRKMEFEEIIALVKNDLGQEPPKGVSTTDEVVDWLMAIQA